MKPMRLMYAAESHPSWISGSATVSRRVARWMARRHDVTYVCPEPPRGYGRSFPFDGQLILLKAFANPWRRNHRLMIPDRRVLARLLDGVAPDILHIYDPSPASICLLRLALKRRVKVVISHFFYPHFGLEYLRLRGSATDTAHTGFLAAATLRILASYYDRASAVVVLTQIVRDYLRPYVKPPIEVISAGVDYEKYSSPPKTEGGRILKQLGINQSPTVLFVGRLDIDKNLEVMLRAWKLVVEQQSRHHLLMVGDGMERTRLLALAHQLNIHESISWTGVLPEDLLPSAYAIPTLCAFLITSKVETQSIVTLQALAAGIPVVAANSGALPELVIDNQTGIRCSPDSPESYAHAVLTLGNDPELRRSLQAQCQLAAARHTFKASAAAYEHLYAVILGGSDLSKAVPRTP